MTRRQEIGSAVADLWQAIRVALAWRLVAWAVSLHPKLPNEVTEMVMAAIVALPDSGDGE